MTTGGGGSVALFIRYSGLSSTSSSLTNWALGLCPFNEGQLRDFGFSQEVHRTLYRDYFIMQLQIEPVDPEQR